MLQAKIASFRYKAGCFFHHQFSSRFRSNTEAGFCETNGSTRSACFCACCYWKRIPTDYASTLRSSTRSNGSDLKVRMTFSRFVIFQRLTCLVKSLPAFERVVLVLTARTNFPDCCVNGKWIANSEPSIQGETRQVRPRTSRHTCSSQPRVGELVILLASSSLQLLVA